MKYKSCRQLQYSIEISKFVAQRHNSAYCNWPAVCWYSSLKCTIAKKEPYDATYYQFRKTTLIRFALAIRFAQAIHYARASPRLSQKPSS